MKSSTAYDRLTLLVIVAVLWIAAVAAKGVVRPTFDSHVPDWLRLLLGATPSLLGGLSLPLCFVAVHPGPAVSAIRWAGIWSLIIVIVAEVLERYLPGSTFDWLDVTASVLGVVAGTVIAWLVRRHTPMSSTATVGMSVRRATPDNKSLDASGGKREVIADFQLPIVDLIRAAASTEPLGIGTPSTTA
jgi:hypothetical protein